MATSRPAMGWKAPATGMRFELRPLTAATVSSTTETTALAQASQATQARMSRNTRSGMPRLVSALRRPSRLGT